MVYINPTYWRRFLNEFQKDYYLRYIDRSIAIRTSYEAKELGIYNQFYAPALKKIEINKFLPVSYIDDFKSIYYHDLNALFEEEKIEEIPPLAIDEKLEKQMLGIAKSYINFESNCSFENLENVKRFPQIDVTFYLGPYNRILCHQINPEYVKNHDLVIEEIKEIFKENEVAFIDGSYQSMVKGSFMDVQHFSEYGAYLTAKDIKTYYEKP